MSGHQITFEIPEFDLTEFLKTPNADEFIKKAYLAAAKKIAREEKEKKNGTVLAVASRVIIFQFVAGHSSGQET